MQSAAAQTIRLPYSKKALWTGRIISALPIMLLLFNGVLALMKPPVVIQGTLHMGYPERLVTVLGILQIACAIVYLIPRTSVLGAILITAYLGGATASHVRIGEPFFLPVTVALFVWIGLYLREERLRALVPLRIPNTEG